jgi:hypothetical protein
MSKTLGRSVLIATNKMPTSMNHREKARWILNQLVLTFEAMKFKHWILNP